MLAEHGITAESVYQQWPKLQLFPSDGGFDTANPIILTPELDRSLQFVSHLVAEYVNPPMLETEHLLLSLLEAENELAHWLNQRGVRSEEIKADIRKRYGYQEGPLPIEPESISNSGQWAGDSGQSDTFSREPASDLKHPFSREPASDLKHPFSREPASDLKHPFSREPEASAATANSKQRTVATGQNMQNGSQRQSEIHPSSFITHPCFRIIDAAANRAREALRVIEDFVRFALDDRRLTEQCKQLRHDLAALLGQIPGERLLAARETQSDVGTMLSTPSEEQRSDATDVLAANFARLQESLRSLEEFGKLIDPIWAAKIKQFRYRTYTLHRAVEITRTSIKRLANARLYVLIDGRATLEEFRQLVQTLISAGVHILQLRDKKLDDRQLLERGRILYESTRGTSILFIMNDRPDMAALCRADGVHLGQEDMSIKDARAIVGPDALIGVSTHTIQQARQAVLDGANYIGAGPTFPSETKQFEKFPGLDFLREIAAEIRLPAFAIGGITPQNLPQVLQTGITRVAIAGAIASIPNPAAMVYNLLGQLGIKKS